MVPPLRGGTVGGGIFVEGGGIVRKFRDVFNQKSK